MDPEKGTGREKGIKNSAYNSRNKYGLRNPCKLSRHKNHEWKDCVINPDGEKFKGTAKNFKD